MSSRAFAKEQAVAISAVLKASLVATKVQDELVGSGGVQKKDKSPVTSCVTTTPLSPWRTFRARNSMSSLTHLFSLFCRVGVAVGDYTSQALITSLLLNHFPTDEIVGEEDSSELNQPANSDTKRQIVRLANEALVEQLPLEQDEEPWREVKLEAGRDPKPEQHWLDLIDRGNSSGGAEGRHWACDPIDGTKGFLRGGQYAVCLGLLERGEVVLGVMGCPNLPVDPNQPEGEKGALFVAVKGQGAYQVSQTLKASRRPLDKLKLFSSSPTDDDDSV